MSLNLNSYQTNLYQKIEQEVETAKHPLAIYLEGGHFDPRLWATPFSINSLNGAIDLASTLVRQFKKRIRIVLGVLIDDLDSKKSKGILIPETLETIFTQYPIVKRDRVLISSERNAKNRGIQTLKRKLPHELITEENDNLYFLADDSQRVLIARICGNTWIAHCATIMAQHYADVGRHLDQRYHRQTYPQIIIDFSEYYDRIKVNRGAELALGVFINRTEATQIWNVCFNDPDGEHYSIDYFTSNDYE